MKLEHQFEQLQLLYELTQAVNRADEPGEIYLAAVEGLVRAVAADRASVMTFDADGVMRYKVWKGISDRHRATMEQPISINWHRGARNVQAITVADVTQDPSLSRLLPAFANEGIRALALIPLLGNGGLIGKFVLYYNAPHEFVTEELQLAQTIATHVAFAAERHLAEAALRESEERFRSTANAAPVIMWLGDTEKGVTFINRQAALFTGIPAEKLSARGWAQVVHPDDLETVRSVHYNAVDRRVGYQVEYRARRADGEYRHMLSTASPRYVEHEYAGHVGSLIDITDLKLRQQEDLTRRKWESIGALAGGIAHDFNNLLGAVLAQAELALGELAPGSSPHEELKAIRDVALRGSEIVRQLMIYAGKETAAVELVDVSQIVRDMLELLKLSVSKHAVIEANLGRDLPSVRANAAQLSQIVMNLVTNASDAIGNRDGVIRVGTRCLKVGQDSGAIAAGLADGDYVQLEVSDTGHGMSLEMQGKVFDPFFTTKAAGHGFGLAVVQGIVRTIGGSIHLTSEPDKATTFQIMLPCAETTAAVINDPVSDLEEPIRSSQPGTVLVVEDEFPLREAVGKMLHNSGFKVFEACDGFTAISLLRANGAKIDVILLDITIPGATSQEVMAEAVSVRPDIRVVLTSAYSAETITNALSAPQVRAFIRKPFQFEDLVKTLRRSLVC